MVHRELGPTLIAPRTYGIRKVVTFINAVMGGPYRRTVLAVSNTLIGVMLDTDRPKRRPQPRREEDWNWDLSDELRREEDRNRDFYDVPRREEDWDRDLRELGNGPWILSEDWGGK